MARVRRPSRRDGPATSPIRRKLGELRRARRAFEDLVAEAIRSLPRRFRVRLENVDVVVEDSPTAQDLESVGMRKGETLFGLYRGVPRSERSVWTASYLPDQIVIYRRPLESLTKNREELVREIRITIMHEVGHFFGMDEENLKDAGYE